MNTAGNMNRKDAKAAMGRGAGPMKFCPPISRPPVFANSFAKASADRKDRQAGPIKWLFHGPPAGSRFLAANKRRGKRGGGCS
jgi:hypothetical protein